MIKKPDLSKLRAFKKPEMKKPEFKKPAINFDMDAFQKKLKGFDWRSLQKYTSPKAADDLNTFLEKMPQNAGQTMLIIAGVAWAFAGAVGLFTAVQLQKITELRTAYEEANALQPVVPTINEMPVSASEVNNFVENAKEIYSGLDIKSSGASIVINARTTNAFGQFREAIGHVQNGGSGWRVNVDHLCVGRECEKQPLTATLKINTVSVKSPG